MDDEKYAYEIEQARTEKLFGEWKGLKETPCEDATDGPAEEEKDAGEGDDQWGVNTDNDQGSGQDAGQEDSEKEGEDEGLAPCPEETPDRDDDDEDIEVVTVTYVVGEEEVWE